MFAVYDKTKKPVRHKMAVLDCSDDEILTEQSHVKEVDINAIVKRHGVDLIAQTSHLQSDNFSMDDIPTNDFQEAMLLVTKAQQNFDALPSKLRKRFENNPAIYLDFVRDPDNADELVSLGLATRPPENQPIEVIVTNPVETNPETPPE